MDKVVIDKSKCIGCGECVRDCVLHHIALVDGHAEVLDNRCIECGHCYAICPAGAVDMPGYDMTGLEDTADIADFGADKLLLALRSRRSRRRFTSEHVSDEDVARLLEAGRYSPTGSNRQDVHFIVLREKLAEAEALAVEEFCSSARMKTLLTRATGEVDRQFFFKGAPLAIVCAGKRPVDPALAAAFVELMAQGMHLGVFYSGYFSLAAQKNAALRELLGMPIGFEAVTTLVIGHSDVKYQRCVPRKPLNVIWR